MKDSFHDEPFDEGTKAKLDIFRDYIKEWLPVFISASKIYWTKINICDFFAGPGKDNLGNPGSPTIILDALFRMSEDLIKNKLEVTVWLNEADTSKYNQLTDLIQEYFADGQVFKVELSNDEFHNIYNQLLPTLKDPNAANLLIIDQCGIKQITQEIFSSLINLKHTDFLFFISSSTVKRFSELPSIKNYIPVDSTIISETSYYHIHREVLKYYQSLIPANMVYYLAPFSLRKPNGNVYGLIFASNHLLGIEKFLKTCWKHDNLNGEANFNIDNNHLTDRQIDLFTGQVKKMTKIEVYESELKDAILNKRVMSDRDLYIFTIDYGMTVTHTRLVIKKLISEGKVENTDLNLSWRITKSIMPINFIKLR